MNKPAVACAGLLALTGVTLVHRHEGSPTVDGPRIMDRHVAAPRVDRAALALRAKWSSRANRSSWRRPLHSRSRSSVNGRSHWDAQDSRARRTTPPTPPQGSGADTPSGFAAWLDSAESHSVRACESSFDYTLVDVNDGVTYFGAWQGNEDFVRTYAHVDPWDYVSGGEFTLPRKLQDLMAYRGWKHRGWEPWACA